MERDKRIHTIVQEMTAEDMREQRRAIKARRRHNIYALSIQLGAVQEMENELAAGADLAALFAKYLTPTRANHRIARKIGLALDVQRGHWIKAGGQ